MPPFQSILFADPSSAVRLEAPEFFHDLNLDQVVDAITTGWREYDLAPFFFTPLTELDAVLFRQEVMRDMEDEGLLDCIATFSRRMTVMRRYLAIGNDADYKYEKERWFLDAVHEYCAAVEDLSMDLHSLGVRSRGMQGLMAYLAAYTASAPFDALRADARRLVDDLSKVRYGLHIRDNTVTVLPYRNEADYTAIVEETFARFREAAVTDYRSKLPDLGRLDHIDAQILERVAWLNPESFQSLDAFCARYTAFLDATIARFDREVQFYAAWIAFAERLRERGSRFCYPRLSDTCKEIRGRDAFDLALALMLATEGTPVVTNDFDLRGAERILVITGPNHGGKTTFARAFGQLHYLASLGCPVPGTDAQLFLPDRIFAHFERAERVESLRGKLKDDLVRARRILDQATCRSIIIINEVFASTTLQDAVFLSRQIMSALTRLDALAVCVTFLDELAHLGDDIVSMVSAVDRADPSIRTFKLERRPADGLAYALAIAEKYDVTYERLMQRIRA